MSKMSNAINHYGAAKLLADLLKTGHHSDIEINNGDLHLRLHKCVLFSQAPKLVDLPHEDGFLNLTDDPVDLDGLIKYAYHSEYNETPVNYPSGIYKRAAELIHHVRLASIANKYGATDLLETASQRFEIEGTHLGPSGPIYPSRGKVNEGSDQGKIRVFLNVAQQIISRRANLPEEFMDWVLRFIKLHARKITNLGEVQNDLNGFLRPLADEVFYKANTGYSKARR